MVRFVEGQWDDLVRRQDLRGHTVRVVVLDACTSHDTDHWLDSLTAWADDHPAVPSAVDDSREGIYGGTLDDPR